MNKTSARTIFRARILLAAFSFAALFALAGCGGGGLPGKSMISDPAFAPDREFLRTNFIDEKLSPAIESRDPQAVEAAFGGPSGRMESYLEDIKLSTGGLNNLKFEVLSFESSAEGGRAVVPGDSAAFRDRLTIKYRISGFAGVEYEEFVKQGVWVFIANTSVASGRASTAIAEDRFREFAHVRGKAVDEKDRPVPFCRVAVTCGNFEYISTTLSDGSFSIGYIPPAPFRIRFERPGFIPVETAVDRPSAGAFEEVPVTKLERDIAYSEFEGGDTREISFAAAADSFVDARPCDRAIALTWRLPADVIDPENYRFRIFRRFPSERRFVPVGETDSGNTFTDINLTNGKVHVYKIEAVPKSGDPSLSRITLGPVPSIPSPRALRIEFESLPGAGLKFKGQAPLVARDRGFSGESFLTFDPGKTTALSFLTPARVRSGSYRILLYVRREKRGAAVRFSMKQFGESDDNGCFSAAVDLGSTGRTGRDVVDLGTARFEARNWKNEKIEEDYSDLSFLVTGTPQANAADAEREAPAVSLDMIELIKID